MTRSHLGLLGLLSALSACRSDPPLTAPFVDAFERAELGPDYYNSGGPYRIQEGRLTVAGAHNHPLWLKRKLPRNVRIEFDALSRSPDGDIKVELGGDGQSAQAPEAVERRLRYTATGYVLIFGGWGNRKSMLARQDEHAKGAPERALPRVTPNRIYHFTVVRRGGQIEWSIDGELFLRLDDAAPLEGKGHEHFGFTNWETEVVFDNLRVIPL